MKLATTVFMTFALSLTGALAQDVTTKYENYLNSIQTLSGNFTQTNSKGQMRQGKIAISRPNKMRLTYKPPSHMLVRADGKALTTIDTQTGESSSVSLDNTPAAFILRPEIRFSGDIAIKRIYFNDDGTTDIALIRTDDPDAGYMTLIFQENPLSLRGWRITESQGETRVSLSDTKLNVTLSPDLFQVKSPRPAE